MSNNRPLRIGVLGSTGSIGTQTLDIVRQNSEAYEIVFLTANTSVETLRNQIKEFSPKHIALADVEAAQSLSSEFGNVRSGAEGILELIRISNVDAIVVGIIGFSALAPVCEAIKKDVHIALANKEVLVAASSLVNSLLEDSNCVLVPVDSEHNSLFQCMMGRRREEVQRVVITASGGPFLNTPYDAFGDITPETASKHPNWDMGKKISIDSATLMNKGLEVIEAAALFDLSAETVEVLVHPQSIVHGFVEFKEGTSIAALYHPDMRIPIAFALDYIRQVMFGESRISKTGAKKLDLLTSGPLSFFEPDTKRFPCLSLAYQALNRGGSAPTVLNAANEVAVEAFCERIISFIEIPKVIEAVMEMSETQVLKSIEEIIKVDSTTRISASEVVENLSHR